ncbi:MAG TPA: hypothetical protein VK187_04850, partial [Geobacteraceae bacterium]|nr:hypothetical protein [Geobacteraceae bacterium]
MIRKSLFLLTVVCALSVVSTANAWTLSTRVLTVGGSLQYGTYPVQTSANGTVTRTLSSDVMVTLTPNAGYKISAVAINGVSQPLPIAANPFPMGLGPYPGRSSQ